MIKAKWVFTTKLTVKVLKYSFSHIVASNANPPIVINLAQYISSSKDTLKPPVSNKIMFNGSQLKLMIVGGPNQRDDFHVEDGEELFIQLKGSMELHVMNSNNSRQNINISEMEMFLLPSHIPHSPQRFTDTIGLVIERTRLPNEKDSLRWYYPNTSTSTSDSTRSTSSSAFSSEKEGKILYEESFYCEDLGTQLKPVIERFSTTSEYKTYIEDKKSVVSPIDYKTLVSKSTTSRQSHSQIRPPFLLMNEIQKLRSTAASSSSNIRNINMMDSSEFKVDVISSFSNTDEPSKTGTVSSTQLPSSSSGDIFLWQLKHSSTISFTSQNQSQQTHSQPNSSNIVSGKINNSPINGSDKSIVLNEGDVCLLPALSIDSLSTQPHVTQSLAGPCLLVVTNKIFQKPAITPK